MRKTTIRTKRQDQIDALVAERFGPLASIESVKEVSDGGIAGFFASRVYEVAVTIPEQGDTTVPVLNQARINRENISDLLVGELEMDAPTGKGRRGAAPMLNTEPLGSQRPPKPPVHEEPLSVPQVMRMVERSTSSEPLAVYAGLFTDAADLLGSSSYKAGALNESAEPVSGEVAFGLGNGGTVKHWAEQVKRLKPTHVYAVVDPSRKHEDSAVWLHELDAVVPVEAVIAAPHGARTLTPGTLNMLGYPVHER